MESKTIDLTTATGSIVEKQAISNDDIFDEVDTDEGAVKKNLNVLLNVTPSFTSHKWGEIHKALNNGIVGKEVPAKDCYRIGFINKLKEFAKTHNILFARDGNKLYVYSGKYWISISEELMKEFLHKAASKMGIPHSLSYCVKFIKGVYSQLSELGFYEKMVKSETTYLNLSNGALKIDINGVELADFNPKYFLTHKLDFAYDINAKNQRWLDFLDMVIPDKDTQKTLQQALGSISL